jgi:beta-glucosidase
VDALLARMTLEEKVGQMVQIDIDKFMLYDNGVKTSEVNFTMVGEWIRDYRIGSILNTPFSFSAIGDVSAWSARKWRDNLIEIQKLASTLGSKIPIIYGIDSIHGASYVGNATLFPQQIGLAATFNTKHAYVTGKITSKDTRVAGIPWVFSPVLGVALQPLWPRFYETFGEDTYLISQMGAEIIRGYQWDAEDGGFPERVAACMKHFIAYSDPENGHDRSPVQLPHRVLKQLYSQQFQAAVDAGVLTAMESYQEVGGVPMISSRDYLKKLLRVEMNFTGFIVTDYREIENLHDWHHVAASEEDAVRITLQDTSVDQSMVPLDESFYKLTLSLVRSGKIPESRIDESARRILEVKDSLGLLSTPVPPEDHPLLATVGQKEDWDAALDACRESLTLLKNENGALPLKEADAPKLFVTGPTCDSLARQTGGWSVHWQGARSDSEFAVGKTVLKGLMDIFQEVIVSSLLAHVHVCMC